MDKLIDVAATTAQQIVDAIKDMSGHAYQMLMSTCKAQAASDITGFVVLFVLMCVAITLFVLFVIATTKDEDWLPGAIIFGLASAIMFVIFLCQISDAVFAWMVLSHPDICIGKFVISSIHHKS